MGITQIKETCIYISDIGRTFEFYHEKLSLPIISRVADRHIFFRAGRSVLLCFLPEITKEETTLPPHYAYGPQHLAFEIPLSEYELYKEILKSKNISIIHEHQWPNGMESCYFKDPDGHVLEFIPENFWESS